MRAAWTPSARSGTATAEPKANEWFALAGNRAPRASTATWDSPGSKLLGSNDVSNSTASAPPIPEKPRPPRVPFPRAPGDAVCTTKAKPAPPRDRQRLATLSCVRHVSEGEESRKTKEVSNPPRTSRGRPYHVAPTLDECEAVSRRAGPHGAVAFERDSLAEAARATATEGRNPEDAGLGTRSEAFPAPAASTRERRPVTRAVGRGGGVGHAALQLPSRGAAAPKIACQPRPYGPDESLSSFSKVAPSRSMGAPRSDAELAHTSEHLLVGG